MLKLYEKLISFAQSQPKVIGLYRGVCPEEATPRYYFLTGLIPHDFELSEGLTEFELELMGAGINVSTMQWPCTLWDVIRYGFLEVELWRRD